MPNFVDILFILLLLGALALGFFQGTIRLLIAMVAFYVAIVLASLYFTSLGLIFQQRFHSSLRVGQITAFALIMLVAFLLLAIAGLYTFRYAKMPASLDFVDRIIGTIFGLLLGGFFLGMLAVILRLLFYPEIGDPASLPIVGAFQGSVRGSFLVGFFSNRILPLIFVTLQPILPRNAIEIFFQIR
jgi:membrane protein required for colicin V production